MKDKTPPSLRVEVERDILKPGDEIFIKAYAEDDKTGVYSVFLEEGYAWKLLGEGCSAKFEENEFYELRGKIPADRDEGEYILEVVAMDRAGNESSVFITVHVEEEIKRMELEFEEGLNLFSIPKELENPSVAGVFGENMDKVMEIWTYKGDRKIIPEELVPGYGYILIAKEDFEVELSFKEFDPTEPPQAIELEDGWNLIGYASNSLEPYMSVGDYLKNISGKWAVIYNEEGEEARPSSYYPYIWATDGFPTITGKPFSNDPGENLPKLEILKAYWIYMIAPGYIIP